MMRIDRVSLLYLILKLFQYILSSVKKIKHSNIEYNHDLTKHRGLSTTPLLL